MLKDRSETDAPWQCIMKYRPERGTVIQQIGRV